MKKLNQNASVKFGGYKIVTTRTRLFVYNDENCNKLVGCAGVKNPNDFDFDTLFRMALHKSGSKIEVV